MLDTLSFVFFKESWQSSFETTLFFNHLAKYHSLKADGCITWIEKTNIPGDGPRGHPIIMDATYITLAGGLVADSKHFWIHNNERRGEAHTNQAKKALFGC